MCIELEHWQSAHGLQSHVCKSRCFNNNMKVAKVKVWESLLERQANFLLLFVHTLHVGQHMFFLRMGL